MLPSTSQRNAIHTLWDELADYPAARADAALAHLMERVGTWLGADNMVWVGAARVGQGVAARRDAQYGWRGLAVSHWRVTPELLAASRLATDTQTSDPGMTTRALAASAGQWRTHRLRDGWVDFAAFRRTTHYATIYHGSNIGDRLFAGIPVNADSEAFLLADRYGAASRFRAGEAALLAYAMRGLKWFHRELLLFHGILVADKPLSPTERRIVRLLLTERSEAEIAAALGQSPATTHKYITALYRKYNVRGRAGLMARWLNRNG